MWGKFDARCKTRTDMNRAPSMPCPTDTLFTCAHKVFSSLARAARRTRPHRHSLQRSFVGERLAQNLRHYILLGPAEVGSLVVVELVAHQHVLQQVGACRARGGGVARAGWGGGRRHGTLEAPERGGSSPEPKAAPSAGGGGGESGGAAEDGAARSTRGGGWCSWSRPTASRRTRGRRLAGRACRRARSAGASEGRCAAYGAGRRTGTRRCCGSVPRGRQRPATRWSRPPS